MKLIKKFFSAIIAAAVALSTALSPVTAYNVNIGNPKTDGTVYAEMLEKRDVIPEGFVFESGFCFVNDHGTECFNGIWDNNGITLKIECADGFVTLYEIENIHDYLSGMKQYSYTKEQLEEVALKLFKKLNPDLLGEYKAEFSDQKNDYGNVKIYRYVNGIRCMDYAVWILIDVRTGAVTHFERFVFANTHDEKFPIPDNLITPLEAGMKYFENGSLDATVKYEIDKETGIAEPYYTLDAIDYSKSFFAENGQKCEIEYLVYDDYYNSLYYDTDVEFEDEYFDWVSGDEYEEYDDFIYVNDELTFNVSGREFRDDYISPEKLLEKIRAEGIVKLPEGVKLNVYEKHCGTYEFEYGKKKAVVKYSYSGEDGYQLEVAAYAQSGKLIAFASGAKVYNGDYDTDANVKTADEALKKYMGDIYSDYKMTFAEDETVIFTRYKNDIPILENMVTFRFDESGNITTFNLDNSIYKGLDFKFGELISEHEAAEKYFEEYPPVLRYVAYSHKMMVNIWLEYQLQNGIGENFKVKAIK
ncbi:MAG: hypothetical protein IJZ72_03605 [Oscillospiraceae bacterium]|nr:hypothetical protein [Oscillospiraceae bacterium]